MNTSSFVRGGLVKALFPYDDCPDKSGKLPHYCLYINHFEEDGEVYVVVCYGTSRLDESLIRAHKGAILSIPSSFTRGSIPQGVTHFVCDHVAVIPLSWTYQEFEARLDFVKEASRDGDRVRQSLFAAFQALEPIMVRSALSALKHFKDSGLCGLSPEKKLR